MSGRLFDPADDQGFQTRAIVPQMSPGAAGAVGNAMAGFGATLAQEAAQLEKRVTAAEAASAEAQVRSHMTRGLADLRRTLGDGDPATIRATWDAGVARLRKEAVEGIPQRHHERAGQLAGGLAEAQLGAVLDLHARRTGDVGRATLLRSLDDLATAGAAATDPAERERITGEMDAAVLGAVEGGLIGAEAGERMRQGARQRLNLAIARGMIRARPEAGPRAVDELPLPPLPPEDLAELRQEAAANFAAFVQEAEAEERAVIQSRNALVTETFSRALAGGEDAPTPAEVEAVRFDLDPTRYRAAMAITTGQAATQDDPAEVGTMLMGLGGDGFEDRLTEAVALGTITPATRQRLASESEEIRRNPVLRQRRADARTAIDRAIPRCGTDDECEAMWGEQGVSDIAGAVLDEWTAWARANPQAKLQEIEDARGVFAQRARDRAVERLLGRMSPLPGVPRAGSTPYGVAEIEAFESETLAALDAGQMGQAEAAWRLTLANQWRSIAPDAETDAEMDAARQREGVR